LVWALIGIYLDKIMPRDFGKSEPWNFICKFKKPNKIIKHTEERHDPKLVKKGNFEVDT